MYYFSNWGEKLAYSADIGWTETTVCSKAKEI